MLFRLKIETAEAHEPAKNNPPPAKTHQFPLHTHTVPWHERMKPGGDSEHHRAACGHDAVRRSVGRRRGARSGERNGGWGRRRHGHPGRAGLQDERESGPVPLVRQRSENPENAVMRDPASLAACFMYLRRWRREG